MNTPINRKKFLKGTVPVAVMPFLMNGFSCRPLGQGSLFQSALQQSTKPGRVLVLVQLDGGNDGLNTVIPLDQYANLKAARGHVLVPEKKVIKLKDSSVTGLHPSLTGLRDLYNNKQLTIIQGVGYPDPVFSHFRAIDIWHTGSGASTVLNTGWLGRFLNNQYPGFPDGYPSTAQPHPPALQISNMVSSVLQGPAIGMGMAISASTDFYDLVTGSKDATPSTPAGNQLSFIRMTATETQQYLSCIKATVGKQKNLSGMYPQDRKNPLADQLKMVAQLIGGGLETKVYIVSLTGFDTHGRQVDPSQPEKGTHARLLEQVSTAVAAFEDDLRLMGKLDNVLGMTYSEFGRRIRSNASDGTDHGSSGPILLFGSRLKGGLVGTNPVIPDKVEGNDNLSLQHDFRSVYASVLKGWFGLPDSEVDATVLAKYPILDLFV